jgi:transposase
MKEKSKICEINNIKIMHFDEGRFGTMSTVKRKWAEKGSKCEIKVKQGYKSFYTYSSTCSKSGEIFSLLLPEVNTKMMNIYLEELSKRYENNNILLIMDRAGWHKSKDLKVPKNIKIEYLPPYSPELNPVERLWKWLKENTIHNRIFEKVEEVMDAVVDELKKLTREKIMSLCKCNYL